MYLLFLSWDFNCKRDCLLKTLSCLGINWLNLFDINVGDYKVILIHKEEFINLIFLI
jgi:hypothetical protein